MNRLKILLLVSAALILLGCSREAPPLEVAPEPEPETVKINEVYSRGTASAPDWVEIYNPTTSEVDLSGYKVYDLGGRTGLKAKKAIPAGTLVPANGFYVLICDTLDATGLEIADAGETLWLENGSGGLIDSVAVPALGRDTSYARQPDGSTSWATLSPVTKGGLNSLLPIMMNEIYSRGVPGNLDWIELYNPSGVPISLDGYKIYDIGGQSGSKPKKAFPAGATIPANGYYVIVTDTASFSGDLSGFGLSSAGEQAWLENAAGTIIDNVTFLGMDVTQTYGRIPNGGRTWQLCSVITRGSANQP
jgi:hypothetical protein